MSFLNSLARLFNLGGNDDDERDDNVITDDDPDAAPVPVNTAGPTPPPTTDPDPEKAPLVVDENVKCQIFEGVLEVFNKALPSFLADSVDTEAQKRELMKRLDSSIVTYLDTLGAEARHRAEQQLRSLVEASKADAEKLRRQMQSVEQQKDKIREQQLSAERRRRALADRVTDLESQLATSEAEREQFELENRSLLNKLKVSELQASLPEDAMAELLRLRERVAEFEQGAQLSKEMNSQSLEQIAELNSTLNEEREKAAGLRNALEEKELKADNLSDQLKAERDKARELTETVDSQRQELVELNAQLEEAAHLVEAQAELQKQFEKVDAQIKKRDDKIASLKESNKKLREELNQTRQTLEAFREADNNNLFSVAANDEKKAPELFPEDDFECPEWFVGEPEPGHELQRPDNSDFGYVEPPRKPKAPESDAQLSLF